MAPSIVTGYLLSFNPNMVANVLLRLAYHFLSAPAIIWVATACSLISLIFSVLSPAFSAAGSGSPFWLVAASICRSISTRSLGYSPYVPLYCSKNFYEGYQVFRILCIIHLLPLAVCKDVLHRVSGGQHPRHAGVKVCHLLSHLFRQP
jgi:hypothetical protein